MVIHWELRKKLKFDHTIKLYMHNLESFIENKAQKLFSEIFRLKRMTLSRKLFLELSSKKIK